MLLNQMNIANRCLSLKFLSLTARHQNLLYSRNSLPVLTLFTKKNEPCSLCDVAKEALEKYSHQFILEEVYIDLPGNEVWRDKYKNDIPVFYLRGEYLMKHRVNEKLLVKKLTELAEQVFRKKPKDKPQNHKHIQTTFYKVQ